MTPLRTIWVAGLLAASIAPAQDAAPNPAVPAPSALSVLEKTVQGRTATWQKLAEGLDASIQHLLPCDPKAAAEITQVNKASEARIAAMTEYLQEAGKEAAAQTAAARGILTSFPTLGTELSTETSEVAGEQAAVSGQVAALTGTAAGRAFFNGAEDGLRRIVALEQQRSDAEDSGAGHFSSVATALRDLVTLLQDREKLVKETQAAFESEGSSWSVYYAARLARAQTECAITKGVPLVSPVRPQPVGPQQGKQK